MNCKSCGAGMDGAIPWCWRCYARLDTAIPPVRAAGRGGIRRVGPQHARSRLPRPRTLGSLLSVALFVGWFVMMRPAFLGGPVSYAMVLGVSMEPTLHEGDLALVRTRDRYAVGDIAAFRVPRGQPGAGAIVIHRIVGGSADAGFITQGDNKDGPDLWRPTDRDILGEMWLRIPGAGRILARLRGPYLLAALSAVLAFLMMWLPTEQRARHAAREWR